jgi:hypothetical protein
MDIQRYQLKTIKTELPFPLISIDIPFNDIIKTFCFSFVDYMISQGDF